MKEINLFNSNNFQMFIKDLMIFEIFDNTVYEFLMLKLKE
jgi:hypothetical protein